jgi:hypothetical protein
MIESFKENWKEGLEAILTFSLIQVIFAAIVIWIIC